MDTSNGGIIFICFGIPLLVGLAIGLQHGTGFGIFWGVATFYFINLITTSG